MLIVPIMLFKTPAIDRNLFNSGKLIPAKYNFFDSRKLVPLR